MEYRAAFKTGRGSSRIFNGPNITTLCFISFATSLSISLNLFVKQLFFDSANAEKQKMTVQDVKEVVIVLQQLNLPLDLAFLTTSFLTRCSSCVDSFATRTCSWC